MLCWLWYEVIKPDISNGKVHGSVSVCRERGMQLARLLQSKDTNAALKMLLAEPVLAWIRDDESGGYPLHIAVWHVRTIPMLLACLPYTPAYKTCIIT